MTVRRCVLAGVLGGLGLGAMASPLHAQFEGRGEPYRIVVEADPSANPNQRTAEAIVAALRANSQLRGYRIDVAYFNGVAELHGQISSDAQREAAKATAMQVAGVVDVRDQLVIPGQEVRAANQEFGPAGVPGFPPTPAPIVTPVVPPVGAVPGPAGPVVPGQPVAAFHTHNGALPNPQYQPPPLPPYAWPTYAPYNNYSRVATPKLYSHGQWPFIGPMYPYPKVPLGWRRVTLEWQDGSWWYGRESNGHDWWRVRYW